MPSVVLPLHPGLAGRSRVASSAKLLSSDTMALTILLVAGLAAAVATICLDLPLRIPGHAILRGIFPMALGLAFAPRRMGGTVMGGSAVASALMLHTGGFGLGAGALTSLAIIGPCLDVCLWRAEKGRRLYFSFMLAGLACNLIALTVRAATKFGGFDVVTARPFADWWLQAVGTYTLCGLIAGLVSAAVWFRFSSSDGPSTVASEPKS